MRLSCEAVIFAINEHSPDVLKAHAALALPLVFIAMHQVKGQSLHDCLLTHANVSTFDNIKSLWTLHLFF